MRWAPVVAAALSLAACQKVVEPAKTVQSGAADNSVSPYTVARICADGIKIYGPPPCAIFDGGQFFNIEGTPSQFCEQKK